MNRALICGIVLGAIFTAVTFAQTQPTTQELDRPVATLEGRTIRLLPSGATLRAPDSWFGQSPLIRFTPSLSRDELEQVRTSSREWQREFAQIANAVFPFESCSVQFGSNRWGQGSNYFAAVHVRAYVLREKMQPVLERMNRVGMEEAKKVTSGIFGEPRPPSITPPQKAKEWTHVKLSMDLWFIDYGGTAHIECYLREFGEQTVALVFMYAQTPRTPTTAIQEIVDSFQWPQ